GYETDVTQLLGFDDKRRELLKQVEDLRRQRNEVSESNKGQRPNDEQLALGREIKDKLTDLEHQLSSIEQEFMTLLKSVPNMPLGDVPVGVSEDENVVAREVGSKKDFDFKPKSHWELADARMLIDKERAAKVAGSRFAYIKGDLVFLQMSIIRYVMDMLGNEEVLKAIAAQAGLDVSAKPFTPVLPPLMIRTESYEAMDRLEPRDDRYKIEGEELWLQGSAEHVLGSMHADEIFEEKDLPIRYLGYATSFRKEAGTYGKDMEGIIRMHQFDKLEMESFTVGEAGLDEHLFMVAIQEYLLQQLQLPYRVMTKCTADIGKPNARGIDMDAWLPGQGKYRETHTADYMTDYQSRRLKTRVRRSEGAIELAHTNDGTAFALGRIMVAIIENYQMADGSILVPDVLRPYMGKESF
ncbi:serine--tRNA ligase, partial [Candidatus Saccharibacteria bacterium]|nr:serine--tRNA ligase [Candidatus Saccharibacteria bacterium]